MSTGGSRNVLVAGIGNVFLGDDGFGVEVVRRLDPAELPATADVADYGIRGVHLAYELLDGRYDTLILVDAVPLDGPPGTLAVIEADDRPAGGDVAIDGHGLHPDAVLRLLNHLGGGVERVVIVGCRPAVLDEVMELSEPVAAAVEGAVRLVAELAWQEAAGKIERETTDA
ncbi:hydrogenase maturation protease [Nonomuraea sp. NPDC049758]|uniref:hydrogenase maturation protease n=1 Tax=Nonomuraea sp. NPDC049758 TaxID=3154360 RepID=UPI003449D9F1